MNNMKELIVKKFKIIYKCQFCGSHLVIDSKEKDFIQRDNKIEEIEVICLNSSGIIKYHTCDGETTGIMDLIGVKINEDK